MPTVDTDEGNERVVFEAERSVAVRADDVPDPAPDEVCVRSARTLVSTGTELTVLGGEYEADSNWADIAEFPFRPGYNNVGEVVSVGEGVEEFAVGDRVAAYGKHAKYAAVPVDACRPVPDGVGDDEAAFFTIAEIVMNGVRRGRLTWGEGAVVYGLGLLGQLAVRVCHAAGARPVVGVDVASARLDRLPALDGVVGVDPTERDPAEVVREATGGRLADAVFEVTGNPDVITDELGALREQGRLVVLSSPKGTTAFDFHDHCNAPSYEIIGAHNGSHPSVATPANPWTQARHGELFFEYLLDGSVSVGELVSHSRPYREAPDLYGMLLEDRSDAMGVLLEWDGE